MLSPQGSSDRSENFPVESLQAVGRRLDENTVSCTKKGVCMLRVSLLSLLGAGSLGVPLTYVDFEIKVLGSNVFDLG